MKSQATFTIKTKRSIDTTNTNATCNNPDSENNPQQPDQSIVPLRSLENPTSLTFSCLLTTSSNLVRRIVRLIVRLNIFVRPMRILDILDLEEPIRIGATHPQSRADAFAVLLLALEADGLDFVLLSCFVPREKCCVSSEVWFEMVRGDLQHVGGLVWVFACCGHAGEEGRQEEEDGEVSHFFRLVSTNEWLGCRV
jgi:hypothetical protein